jgi:CubicO group peptidase (beta-lactamase class C family)
VVRESLRSALRALAALAIALQPVGAWARASLDGLLEPVRRRHGLPALAAAVVVRGEVVAAGAVGRRRVDAATPVTLQDRFHLGSCTKAMTALLAAIAVERGLLRWDSTLAELFPGLRATMRPAMAGVTVRQLLSHSSGIGDDALAAALQQIGENGEANLDGLRLEMVKIFVRQPLQSPPGTRFLYGNANYIVVGAALERLQGRTWEELIQEQIFQPLALAGAGLGPQSTPGLTDAPLGHRRVQDTLLPMLAGPNGDNLPVIGPAGTVHMGLLGAARWLGWTAGEGRRGPELVSPESQRLLHTPVIVTDPNRPEDGSYALGWGVVKPAWASGPWLMHAGSNTMNLAQFWVDPRRDVAVVLLTNTAGPQAEQALRTLAPLLVEQAGLPPGEAGGDRPPARQGVRPKEPQRSRLLPMHNPLNAAAERW